MIVFDKCDKRTSPVQCKSEKEIEEWMQDVYILTYINEKQFIQDKFESDRLQQRAVTRWIALNSNSRSEYVFKIQRT